MEKKIEETNWEITTNRFVAFIDIMGFKDMVLRNSHEDIYSLMQSIHEVKKNAQEFGGLVTGPDLVRITTYSDSIILYSKDSSEDAFYSLTTAVSSIMTELFFDKIPHKGAIAFGLMTLDEEKSIFFGQPLIDAYLLQDELLFYGVILHASAEKESKEKNIKGFNIKNYPVLLKQGTCLHLTICPMYSVKTDKKEIKDEQKRLLNSLDELRFRTSGHLRKYIDNTRQYFRSLIS